MSAMSLTILAAVLFVLGLAAIGGATFGRKRNQRLILAALGLVLWGATLYLYAQVGASVSPATPPTPSPTTAQATDTPAPALSPVPETPVTPPATALPAMDFPGRLVFHSARTGDLEIYTMNADGTDVRQLTNTPGRDLEPDWSPDGTAIVFTSARDNPNSVQLYLMNSDGSNQQPLMPFVAADYLGAAWSPDGERIAFYTNVDGNMEVYTVRKDGSDLTNLSRHPSNDMMPDWSPDGQRLLFVSERDGNRELYVMNADGSNQVRLTDSFESELRPRWSPDGKTILFQQSTVDDQSDLYVMDAPSASVAGPIDETARLLTLPIVRDESPNWALDGQKIIFSSDRDTEPQGTLNWELYVMNPDGSDVVRLTYSAEMDRFPAWTR